MNQRKNFRIAAVFGLAALSTLVVVACSSSDENPAPGPEVVGGTGGGGGNDSGAGDSGGTGGSGGSGGTAGAGGTGGSGGSAGDAGTDGPLPDGAVNACANAPTTQDGWLNAATTADSKTVTLTSPQIAADGGVPALP